MPCAVCQNGAVGAIDRDLQIGGKSRRSIAKEYGLSLTTLNRHAAHRAVQAGYLAAEKAKRDRRSPQARTHRALDSLLAGTSIAGEIRALKARADRLGASAEASGDAKTALAAVRELTRLVELQARLALEAAQGRTSDVSSHPVFHEVMSVVSQALAIHPEAARDVVLALRQRLSIDVPLTASASAGEATSAEALPFPP